MLLVHSLIEFQMNTPHTDAANFQVIYFTLLFKKSYNKQTTNINIKTKKSVTARWLISLYILAHLISL
jgi:hypothetical protein